jgi:sulfite reductase (NADPH) flavoprotein alpha-component
MAVDVHRALLEVVRTHGRRNEAEAKEYVAALTQSGRYQRDVY